MKHEKIQGSQQVNDFQPPRFCPTFPRLDVRCNRGTAAGARCRHSYREGHKKTRSFRASLQRTLRGCRRRGGFDRTRHLRRGGKQEIHSGSDRLRLRFHRLRQRWLDRYFSVVRHAPGGRSSGRNQSPVQEQPRRHLHRCHREGRIAGRGLGVRRLHRRLQQRRIRRYLLSPTSGRTVSIATTATARLPTSPRPPGFVERRSRAGAPAAVSWITTGMGTSICSSPITCASHSNTRPCPGENVNCNWKGVPVECGPRGLPTGRHSLYRNNGDGTFTDVSEAGGHRERHRKLRNDSGRGRSRRRWLARYLCRLRFHAESAVHEQP